MIYKHHFKNEMLFTYLMDKFIYSAATPKSSGSVTDGTNVKRKISLKDQQTN
jgi:hypothetical protein